MNRFVSVLALSGIAVLAGCVAPTPKPNDPYYAPVLPRTPLPAAANNGSIYQAGFEQNLYSDRKAFRVGDIITIPSMSAPRPARTPTPKWARTAPPALV